MWLLLLLFVMKGSCYAQQIQCAICCTMQAFTAKSNKIRNIVTSASADKEMPLLPKSILDKHFIMLFLRVPVMLPDFCILCWAYCCLWHTSTTQGWSWRSWPKTVGWRRQCGHSSPAYSRGWLLGTHWLCYRCGWVGGWVFVGVNVLV